MRQIRGNLFLTILIVFVAILTVLSTYSEHSKTELTHDPIYNQLVTSDAPMIVSRYKVGDAPIPEEHIEYYNPVSERYYTVVYK